jgi:hypothetical protein
MKNSPCLKMFYLSCSGPMVRTLAFSVTFNNISVISWLSVLLVEETEYPKKTTDLPQITDTRIGSVLTKMLDYMHQKYSRKSSSYPVMCEEIEDTKGVIRIRKSKKDKQHNGQKKKDKRTNNDL